MKRRLMTGTVCAILITSITMSANAAFTGVLPATPGGTDWQAYYDEQLDITWTANANINDGTMIWSDANTWAAGLNINGVTGWRLPSMDVDGDGVVVNCTSDSSSCADNEMGFLFWEEGITAATPSPFSSIQSGIYWSGTEDVVSGVWGFNFGNSSQGRNVKSDSLYAWAVHDGNVSAIPVPAALWLFGSGLLGLIGIARRKKA